jgi:hypothetical protein
MENQWDGKADHDITAKQLFEASRDPKDTIELLKKETTDAKNAGHRDYVKELELLRFEKQDGLITDAEYDQKTIEQTIDRFKEFKDGKIDPNSPEYLGATKELVVMLNNLDISDKPADHQRADAIRNAIKGQAKEIAEHKQGVTL